MNKKISNKVILIIGICLSMAVISFKQSNGAGEYQAYYKAQLESLKSGQQALLKKVTSSNLQSASDVEEIKAGIQSARARMKAMDFWLRYLEPIAYKQVNGPLPVEWETEVFEKFEKPYKRDGAGLTLAYLYLEEEQPEKAFLEGLVNSGIRAMDTYAADSITRLLSDPGHFFLCNRLYLLNLAAIYSTGFECPDTSDIIPELKSMVNEVHRIYQVYNSSFRSAALRMEYIDLYKRLEKFLDEQPVHYSSFDHFSFIRDYVNPLFALNQQMIREYRVISRSTVDYALDKNSKSIFSKTLYNGQNAKGIFLRVEDEAALAEIDRLGKLLFYDPILSGNNQRSCASCHKPTELFTDTMTRTHIKFDHGGMLSRNTPSLVNATHQHLLMADGVHISLQKQARAVVTNPDEMGSDEKLCLSKVMSCKEYKKAFKTLLQYTPQEGEVTFEHIISAVTYYYSKFSQYNAPFDEAMNTKHALTADEKCGFNLFMSKAQCATCHFVPNFNGVKPPYVGSEFEVLGVPADTAFKSLSTDHGRYGVNPAKETHRAFRTGTLRNTMLTGPYMHNGVFTNMMQVIDFYNGGGGEGRGLEIHNQTLSSDSLGLTQVEKLQLIAFIRTLNENIPQEKAPLALPASSNKTINRRKIGGEY